MRTRSYLLATVSGLALAGSAQAADLVVPTKAPPPFVAAALWAGPYIGLNLGVVRHDWSFTDLDNLEFITRSTFWTDSKTGFTIGGQIGWNWQSGNFVYGVEADINWIDAKRDITFTNQGGFPQARAVSELNWLSTFRGRAGLAVDRTLVYLTAGLALAGINDRWGVTSRNNTFTCACFFVSDKTRVGWAAGGGVEHMFAPQWTGRAEILYADLGRDSAGPNRFSGRTYRSEFTNALIMARAGVNYKW